MEKYEAIQKIRRIVKGNTEVETDDYPFGASSRNVIKPTIEQDLVDFIEKYWKE